MSPELHGWIGEFWEQGMEEPPWHVFQDEAWAEGPQGGWLREGMHTFKAGDHLTILDPSEQVLWSGRLKRRRVGLFRWLDPASSDWHPEDVPQATWGNWFVRQPPLRARFRPG